MSLKCCVPITLSARKEFDLRLVNGVPCPGSSRSWTTARSGKIFSSESVSRAAYTAGSCVGMKAGGFEHLMRLMGRLVEEQCRGRLYECVVDGTFAKAEGGSAGIGYTKAGKGRTVITMLNIMQGMEITTPNRANQRRF